MVVIGSIEAVDVEQDDGEAVAAFHPGGDELSPGREAAPGPKASQRVERGLPDQLEGFGRIEPAVIERAAGNGTGDERAVRDAQIEQGAHVLDRGEAA